jgi:hypothetical protein
VAAALDFGLTFMVGRVSVLLAAAVLVLAGAPSAVALQGAGPVLAGSAAVTAFGDAYSCVRVCGPAPETVHVTVIHSDGSARRVWDLGVPRDGDQQDVEALAASSTHVALLRQWRDPSPPYNVGAWQLFVGGVNGAFQELALPCVPTNLAIDGDELVGIGGFGSSPSPCAPIWVYDLATGQTDPLPWNSGDYLQGPGPVRIAGRFVAWSMHRQFASPADAEIVVFDRVARREVYRVNVGPYLHDGGVVNYDLNFVLRDDGTIVAAVPDYQARSLDPTILWSSVPDPSPHVVPVDAGAIPIAVAGDLIAVRRAAPANDFAVVDFSGNVHDVFDYHREPTPNALNPYGLDFNGAELTWEEGGTTHIAPYPVEPAPDVPARTVAARRAATSVGVWCPRVAGRCSGTLELTLVPGARRAEAAGMLASGRFSVPARLTRPVRLKLSANLRRLLARHRRLAVRAVVISASGGHVYRRSLRIALRS